MLQTCPQQLNTYGQLSGTSADRGNIEWLFAVPQLVKIFAASFKVTRPSFTHRAMYCVHTLLSTVGTLACSSLSTFKVNI